MMAETKRRTVVVAMDGSKHSEYAYQWYLENVHKDGDLVLLVHSSDFSFSYPAQSMMMNPTVTGRMFHEFDQNEHKVLTELETLLARTKHENICSSNEQVSTVGIVPVKEAVGRDQRNGQTLPPAAIDLLMTSVDGKVLRVYGHAGEGLIEASKEHGADFIVTGTRGLGTIRRTIMGSVSDYILHHSHVPVLICKHSGEH